MCNTTSWENFSVFPTILACVRLATTPQAMERWFQAQVNETVDRVVGLHRDQSTTSKRSFIVVVPHLSGAR